MRRTWLSSAALVFGTACSGGGGADNVVAPPVNTPPAVSSVSVVLQTTQLITGTSTTAAAELRAANGTVLSGRTVSWSSSAATVATVDGAGTITAVSAGTTTISAVSEGRTGTATLTVLPVPVASISVSGASELTPGATTPLAATLRAANGTELQGRSVVWGTSNPSVATVSAAGLVTGIAPGTTTISANSEGQTGTLRLNVRSPVVSVTLAGASRVKVGDTYQYSVTARTSDGSTVTRPVSWSTANPGAGTFTASGLLTPASAGTITIVATIDGVAWEATVTAYDWLSISSSSIVFTTLPSDNQISNRFGSAEYPELTFACSDGNFFVWIDTERFVTENGLVAFSFDGGTPVSQTWLEFDSFSALGKSGTNATLKSFALQMSGARLFTFAFGEFRGSTKVVSYRVTGLATRLTPLLNACPGNSIQSVVSDALRAVAMRTPVSIALPSPELEQLRRERAAAGESTRVPSIEAGASASRGEEMRATRRRP